MADGGGGVYLDEILAFEVAEEGFDGVKFAAD